MFEYSIMKVIACVTNRSLIVKRRIVTADLRQYAMFQLGDQKSKYQEQLDWWTHTPARKQRSPIMERGTPKERRVGRPRDTWR